MKEKIKNALEAYGFELEELDNFGCKFQYEGNTYIWIYSNDDDGYLNIALPGLLDLEEADDIFFYKLMDYLNRTLKYVKANVLCDCMWLFYERELTEDEDLNRVIPRMILHLYHAVNTLRKALEDLSTADNEEPDYPSADEVIDIEDTDDFNDDVNDNDN